MSQPHLVRTLLLWYLELYLSRSPGAVTAIAMPMSFMFMSNVSILENPFLRDTFSDGASRTNCDLIGGRRARKHVGDWARARNGCEREGTRWMSEEEEEEERERLLRANSDVMCVRTGKKEK